MKIHELVEGVEYKTIMSNDRYRVYDDILQKKNHIDKWVNSNMSYNTATNMEFTLADFRPEKGEAYYFPSFRSVDGYQKETWYGVNTDRNIKKNVGVYKTSKQAYEKARELGWVE